MHWIICCNDKEGSGAIRENNVGLHRAYLKASQIKLLIAGPFIDAKNRVDGSFFLVDAESLEEVESFNRNDPFSQAGVWSDVVIRQFDKRVG